MCDFSKEDMVLAIPDFLKEVALTIYNSIRMQALSYIELVKKIHREYIGWEQQKSIRRLWMEMHLCTALREDPYKSEVDVFKNVLQS